jgi:Ala-tRNA(Pro) deacylase
MDIYRFLADNGIDYERWDHPPVYTVEQAQRLVPSLPAAKTKNLFICDAKGRRHFLVVVGFDKVVDLKALSGRLGVKRLRFASAERLQRHLGVEPGAVSLLGIVNDRSGGVEVVFDRRLWNSEAFQCHPLVNTATLVVSRGDIRKILEITGHAPLVISVPARQ